MSNFCYSHFFSKKYQNICVSLDLNFNESLTNDVVSFEQLGPGFLLSAHGPLIHYSITWLFYVQVIKHFTGCGSKGVVMVEYLVIIQD